MEGRAARHHAAQPLYTRESVDGRIYSVTSVPVEGITGGTLGALVSLKDNTAAWTAQHTLRSVAILAGFGLACWALWA